MAPNEALCEVRKTKFVKIQDHIFAIVNKIKQL